MKSTLTHLYIHSMERYMSLKILQHCQHTNVSSKTTSYRDHNSQIIYFQNLGDVLLLMVNIAPPPGSCGTQRFRLAKRTRS
jgi:hypothetical protein